MTPLARCLFLLSTIAVLPLALTNCERDSSSMNMDDAYPRKPVKVVVPFSAGGGSDTFTRIMQKAIRDHELLPQPLVVINVPGAGGTVGSRRVKDAQADGYTILNLHEGMLSSKYAGRVPYGPEAFRPIAATGKSGLVICVKDDSPYQSLRDLLEAATADPNQVLFGMAPGTPTHFTARKLELAEEGARFRMVASGGGAKRFNDLVGEHIHATPFSLSEFTKFSAAGVRALAYLGESRHEDLPDIPTAREDGYDLTMTHVQYWWAPRSTPDEAVETLANALEAALQTDYVRNKLAELKVEPIFLKGEELATHLAAREADFEGAALVHYDEVPNPVPMVVILTVLLALATALTLRPKPAEASAPSLHLRYAGIALALLTAYVLLMQFANLSFAIATTLFIPLMGFAVGARLKRNILLLGAAGALIAFGTQFLFTEILVIDLP